MIYWKVTLFDESPLNLSCDSVRVSKGTGQSLATEITEFFEKKLKISVAGPPK